MTERFYLTGADGQHIDPARLHAEAFKAGSIDADNARFTPESFTTPEAQAAYRRGHTVGLERQQKPWGRALLPVIPRPAFIDPLVAAVRARLRKVRREPT